MQQNRVTKSQAYSLDQQNFRLGGQSQLDSYRGHLLNHPQANRYQSIDYLPTKNYDSGIFSSGGDVNVEPNRYDSQKSAVKPSHQFSSGGKRIIEG